MSPIEFYFGFEQSLIRVVERFADPLKAVALLPILVSTENGSAHLELLYNKSPIVEFYADFDSNRSDFAVYFNSIIKFPFESFSPGIISRSSDEEFSFDNVEELIRSFMLFLIPYLSVFSIAMILKFANIYTDAEVSSTYSVPPGTLFNVSSDISPFIKRLTHPKRERNPLTFVDVPASLAPSTKEDLAIKKVSIPQRKSVPHLRKIGYR